MAVSMVVKGESANKTVIILQRTVQVKKQVSEAVVRRPQIRCS